MIENKIVQLKRILFDLYKKNETSTKTLDWRNRKTLQKFKSHLNIFSFRKI